MQTRTAEKRPIELAHLRLVVIDDDDDARELLCELLRLEGFAVRAAPDGERGLAMILDHQPDLAIVDLGLPGMDGFDVARSIRDRKPSLRTRLVALTGYGQDADRLRAREAGFDGHLIKPTSLAALLMEVRLIEQSLLFHHEGS